jgi:hypothetical protein
MGMGRLVTARVTVVAVVFVFVARFSLAADAPDFNRDIRPILSDKCFACHGPDEAARKAKLRLDVRDVAVAKGAIVPGDANASELVARIHDDDEFFRMPPPEFNVSLSEAEKALLTAWIAAGAEYQPHWSLIPVAAAPVPGVEGYWARNDIDAFVFERLTREGLTPSPEASKETLLRRVTLDLTGLLPTTEEIAAFLADDAPDAYERVVERLMAAPAYGERMAMDWLDVARYADTFGYQSDVENEVWPWRDWVIGAFNDNLPYDDFITWQLAGDLLENPSQEQRLATTFNRLHRQTNEGGSVNEEFRIEYVADRAETASIAFLGLTMQCARCHDHKYDPIAQRDYYAFTAFFDDIDESGLYSHFTKTAPTPNMPLYRDGEARKHERLRRHIAWREAKLAAVEEEARVRAAAWIAAGARDIAAAAPVLHWTLDAVEESKTADAASGKPAEVTLAPEPVEGVVGGALRFSGESAVSSGVLPVFERTDPFSIALWVKAPERVPHTVLLHRCKAESDAASRGYELMLEGGRPTFSLIHFWPGDAIRVTARESIPMGEWVHIAATYDGSSSAAGARMYVNGEEAALEVIRDGLTRTITYEGDEPPLTLAQRFRDVGFKDGCIDDVQVFDTLLTKIEVAALAQVRGIGEEHDTAALAEHFAARMDDTAAVARAHLHAARKRESEFIQSIPHIMIMEDLPAPRQAYVLQRGQYDQHGDPVEPGTPASVLPFPEDFPRNRLGLAQWLTSPRNPLTARVAVNRYWKLFMGRGLVETQEDFGSQGARPTHPELLDHLAHTFTQDWDVKALVRKIVTSATYRQASAATPELRERDPFNTLLARGPRHRLPAEIIRDNALAASGLLVQKSGGPSVKPYHPEGLWKDAGSVDYVADSGEGLYRRSMYTFAKRTVPPPSMTTFDAPNREVCVVNRERTQTPLQSLVLLNDPQFVEAARVLAANILSTQQNTEAALAKIFGALISRAPVSRERELLRAAYDEQRAFFAADTEGAAAYVATGDAPVPEGIPIEHIAAATAVAQLIMNFDEFQVKR